MITAEDKVLIDQWVAKFPTPQGAVLMALRVVQDREGYLSDNMINAVAEYLELPPVEVYEVVSFYSMYRRKKGSGQYVKICTSLSCCLTGAWDIIGYLEKKHNIQLGKISEEDSVTLEEAECLGACQGAPCAIVNDREYHLNLTPESIDTLIKTLSGESQ